jgi:hypothetical protein
MPIEIQVAQYGAHESDEVPWCSSLIAGDVSDPGRSGVGVKSSGSHIFVRSFLNTVNTTGAASFFLAHMYTRGPT